MAIIKGPDGRAAEVDIENRLKTIAITENIDKHINTENGVFSIYFSVTPVAADDYFFYLKNTGLKDLFITCVRVSSTVATKLFYEHVTGTPVFVLGTPADVTNRNLGTAEEIQADAKYDTDITGLTSQGVLYFEECSVINTRYTLRSMSNIIIPQGQAIAFRREAATGLIDALISVVVAE